MAVQLITGGSGSGKSHYIYHEIIEKSLAHPEQDYLVIVPEQFTMQTQKELVHMHPGGGILNIDVLSFQRLAYRIFEEVGGDARTLLEDTGKMLVLQKVVQSCKKELRYFGSQMNKQGYIQEMKSLISEFMQYDVDEAAMADMVDRSGENALLHEKMKDIQILYGRFRTYLKERFLTAEEVLEVLCEKLPQSAKLRNCTLVFDGFTGFTPVQYKVLSRLMQLNLPIYITVTLSQGENPFYLGKMHHLFHMSKQMIHTLKKLCAQNGIALGEPCVVESTEHSRFGSSPALAHLEQNLFRYGRAPYEGETGEIQIFQAATPLAEMTEVSRRIARYVRQEGYRYGEIAVITGDLKTYGNYAAQVFDKAEVPYFLDRKHSVLMNPFVEYIRSLLDVMVQNFSYESVFRHLRCGLSDLTIEEIDELENYVVALGIRSRKHWEERWVRIPRGMAPEKILLINELRERAISGMLTFADAYKKRGSTVRDKAMALYTYIWEQKLQEKLKQQEIHFASLGEQAMEKEYAQIYGIVMNLLDKLVEILGEESINQREFVQLMEAGLSETTVGIIPPSTDQVLVGDMERTRLKDVKVLFFVGVNDGIIPKNSGNGGFLSDADREFFEEDGVALSPTPREVMYMQRFYLYLNLTKPSRHLCLSYSLANAKGEPMGPAYLVGTIQQMYPKVTEGEGFQDMAGENSGETVREGFREAAGEDARDAAGKTSQAAIGEKLSGAAEKVSQNTGRMERFERPQDAMEELVAGMRRCVGEEPDDQWKELYNWFASQEVYKSLLEKLLEAAFYHNPKDRIGRSVARALYGEVSVHSATRLERYAACAFAHFLRYGLKLNERQVYEFTPMDMGNVMHNALEHFARGMKEKGLTWKDLTEETSRQLGNESLQAVVDDYGNTILHSTARNEYMIRRVDRMLMRTVWALKKQVENGQFIPEGVEVSIGGGRIDRLDICETEDKVYVKVIDYKTGNTSFDLLQIYHGLQLQLMVYLDGALKLEQSRHPDKEVEPAGVFYYNVKDPMIKAEIETDLAQVEEKILRELKMNGLASADGAVLRKMDETLSSLPVSVNKSGAFSRTSTVANRQQFSQLLTYVNGKIGELKQNIETGNADISPYRLDRREGCTYCPYASVCGFDERIPGFSYRRLKQFSDEEIWNNIDEQVTEKLNEDPAGETDDIQDTVMNRNTDNGLEADIEVKQRQANEQSRGEEA